MEKNHNTLSRVLGRTDMLALGFGTIVGWSWVMLATTWLTAAGFWGTILAFLLGSMIILGIGVVYGELAAALPLSGGELIYVYRALGGKAAFCVGWIMAFAYLGVAAWEGIALATAFDVMFSIPELLPLWDVAGYTVHLSWAAIGMGGAVVMLLLNLFGNRSAIIFQVMATAAIILVALILFFGGITFGSEYNIGEGFRSRSGFVYVLLMVPSMFIGFDVIPQSTEEMNIPPKGSGSIIVNCILFCLCWYLIVIVGVAFAAPLEVRVSGNIPVADVMAYVYGDPIFGNVLILGGILGILTSWNGFFIACTRIIFAMGRAKMLPAFFGRLHKKYKTPWAACLLVGGICIVAPLLGKNALIWFVDSSSFCALFTYCWVVVSFLVLRKNEPELARPFKVKWGIPLGCLVVTVSVLYFILYVQDILDDSGSSQQLMLMAIWVLLGFALVLKSRIDYGPISKGERELLLFGEKFARRVSG